MLMGRASSTPGAKSLRELYSFAPAGVSVRDKQGRRLLCDHLDDGTHCNYRSGCNVLREARGTELKANTAHAGASGVRQEAVP